SLSRFAGFGINSKTASPERETDSGCGRVFGKPERKIILLRNSDVRGIYILHLTCLMTVFYPKRGPENDELADRGSGVDVSRPMRTVRAISLLEAFQRPNARRGNWIPAQGGLA